MIQCHDVPFRFIHPNGIEVLVNRRFGVLDAGIPYYKTGGIVFAPSNGISTNIPVNQKNIVYFPNGFPIGTLLQETKSYAIFKPNQFTSSYNEIPLRGISSFIWSQKPLLKIIFQQPQSVDQIHQDGILQFQI